MSVIRNDLFQISRTQTKKQILSNLEHKIIIKLKYYKLTYNREIVIETCNPRCPQYGKNDIIQNT